MQKRKSKMMVIVVVYGSYILPSQCGTSILFGVVKYNHVFVCRHHCLNEVRKCLLSHWMVDFLDNYKETLLDGVEKCLRKGGCYYFSCLRINSSLCAFLATSTQNTSFFGFCMQVSSCWATTTGI